MATSYTTLLGFALPVTGELDGTWGDTVNNSITQLVEDSVAGTATQSVASGDWTLTTTGSGAANQARCAIIRPTGSPGVSRNVIAPGSSKAYIVDNQSNAAVVFKASATTGVTIAAGKQALVAWNGSDFVQVGASAGGSNTQVQFNSSGALGGSANFTWDGSNVLIGAQGDLRFGDSDSSSYVALQAPAVIASDITFTLPLLMALAVKYCRLMDLEYCHLQRYPAQPKLADQFLLTTRQLVRVTQFLLEPMELVLARLRFKPVMQLLYQPINVGL